MRWTRSGWRGGGDRADLTDRIDDGGRRSGGGEFGGNWGEMAKEIGGMAGNRWKMSGTGGNQGEMLGNWGVWWILGWFVV